VLVLLLVPLLVPLPPSRAPRTCIVRRCMLHSPASAHSAWRAGGHVCSDARDRRRQAHSHAALRCSTPPPGMPVIVLRHGERTDYVDKAWVARSARPWDPPLTGKCGSSSSSAALRAHAHVRCSYVRAQSGAALAEDGKSMAKRAGSAIRAFCDEHSLPAPSILLSSPLLRCVETSAGAAEGMGFQVQHYVWLCTIMLADAGHAR